MVDQIQEEIKNAFDRAALKHGEFPKCKFRGIGLIMEEVGELFSSVEDKESEERQKAEALDIIVGALRFIQKHF